MWLFAPNDLCERSWYLHGRYLVDIIEIREKLYTEIHASVKEVCTIYQNTNIAAGVILLSYPEGGS